MDIQLNKFRNLSLTQSVQYEQSQPTSSKIGLKTKQMKKWSLNLCKPNPINHKLSNPKPKPREPKSSKFKPNKPKPIKHKQ